jgi:hypothetical protein
VADPTGRATLSGSAGSAGGPQDTAARTGSRPCRFRLPAFNCAAQTRRLAGHRQAHLPAVYAHLAQHGYASRLGSQRAAARSKFAFAERLTAMRVCIGISKWKFRVKRKLGFTAVRKPPWGIQTYLATSPGIVAKAMRSWYAPEWKQPCSLRRSLRQKRT